MATTPRSMRCTARSTRSACAAQPRSLRIPRAGIGTCRCITRGSATRSCPSRSGRAGDEPVRQHRPHDARRHRGAGRRKLAVRRRRASDRTAGQRELQRFPLRPRPGLRQQRLPAAPDYAVRGEVMYRNASGFFAGPTFDLVGARYADFGNTYRIDAYHLLGLRAGIERERWELFGEVHNLRDKDYVGAISVRDRAAATDAILQPARRDRCTSACASSSDRDAGIDDEDDPWMRRTARAAVGRLFAVGTAGFASRHRRDPRADANTWERPDAPLDAGPVVVAVITPSPTGPGPQGWPRAAGTARQGLGHAAVRGRRHPHHRRTACGRRARAGSGGIGNEAGGRREDRATRAARVDVDVRRDHSHGAGGRRAWRPSLARRRL